MGGERSTGGAAADAESALRAPWGTHQPRGMAAMAVALTRKRIARGSARRMLGNYMKDAQPYFDIEVEGIKMRCAPRDNPTEWGLVFMGARQDHKGRDAIIEPLRGGDVFVDIGANCGAYTLFAARKVGAQGHVIAIEPMPEMLHRLRRNVDLNRFSNVEIVSKGIGAAPGSATLFVDEQRRGLSSLAEIEGAAPIEVQIVTLKSVVEQARLERIDALKIDIEGFEDRALLPYIETTARSFWPTRIYMETDHASRWERDCVAELLRAGYSEEWRGGGDILLRLPSAA